MNKKIPLWVAISVGLLAAVVVMVGTLKFAQLSYGRLDTENATKPFPKLETLDERARQNFFGELNNEKISDALMKAYVEAMGDDYAEYYTAEETKKNTDLLEGSNIGIGVSVTFDEEAGYAYILDVSANSPAAKAGLAKGDRITGVAGASVDEENYDEMMDSFCDYAGETVSINIIKKGEKSETIIDIIPAEVSVQTVFYEMLDTTVVIKITRFNSNTPGELKAAMDATKEATEVIFDLRYNPGGSVDALADALDILLPSADTITATYRDGSSKVLFSSDENAMLKVPSAVLINNSTASSAELFASALKDVKEAKLVGEKSFGKSVMQSTYKMEDGSSFKFTTANLLTPSAQNFNGVGLTPDKIIEQDEDEKKQTLCGEIEDDDVISAAVELLKNK